MAVTTNKTNKVALDTSPGMILNRKAKVVVTNPFGVLNVVVSKSDI